MSLFNKKKELYGKEYDPSLAKHEINKFDPHVADIKSDNKIGVDAWEKKKNELPEYEKKALGGGVLVVSLIVAILLGTIGLIKYKQSAFSEDRVKITINGTQEVDSGSLSTYEISYQNNNRAQLTNAVLRIRYPEEFIPENNPDFQSEGLISSTINLGTIKSYGEGKITFSGRSYSPKGNIIYLNADLIYNPSSASNQIIANNQLGIKIISAPLILEAFAPQNTSSGDQVDYLITYKNIGNKDYSNLKIRVSYPEGYTFVYSEPASSSGENLFDVGYLSAGQEGRLLIHGKLEGTRNDVKVLRAYIGEIKQEKFAMHNEEKAETKIIASPLRIYQIVNGTSNASINAGDKLTFQINYKNEGNIGLRDVIITAKIEGSVLDYASLNSSGGALDQATHKIIWKASDIPHLKFLEPGQEGSVEFVVNLIEKIPVASNLDKNFTIFSKATIDSPDVPTILEGNKIIAGNMINLKVNSKLILDVKGYFYDTMIQNSGAIPPQVGKDTTYTLHWKVSNILNDVVDAKVESVIQTGVTFTGKFFPEDARIVYNERNNSILWEIGNLEAGTGSIYPAKEVAFQVKINPAENKIGDEVELISSTTLKAKDVFTGNMLSVSADRKTSSLDEDKNLKSKDGEVVP